MNTLLKNSIIKTTTVLSFLLIFQHIPALAQQVNFSGNWLQKDRISLSGKDYGNGVPSKIKITQDQTSLTIERSTLTGDQNNPETTDSEKLNTDGSPTLSITPGKRNKSAAMKFSANKTGFTEADNFSKPNDAGNPDFHTTEVWTLSEDGKTLTIIKTFESATDLTDKWSMKGVYKKHADQ